MADFFPANSRCLDLFAIARPLRQTKGGKPMRFILVLDCANGLCSSTGLKQQFPTKVEAFA